MDIPEFRLMLDALGPDLAAWPAPAADAAVALMAASPTAQDLFAAKTAREGDSAELPAALIAKIPKAPQGGD
jgi:hypothetical protein